MDLLEISATWASAIGETFDAVREKPLSRLFQVVTHLSRAKLLATKRKEKAAVLCA